MSEPPNAATLATLLVALKAGSALAGADAWPDAAVAADAANYNLVVLNMTTL